MQEHILTIKSWYDVVFKSDGLTVHPTHYFSFSFFGEETPYFSYCELDELLELISNSSNSSNDIFTLFMVLNYNFALDGVSPHLHAQFIAWVLLVSLSPLIAQTSEQHNDHTRFC